MESRIEERQETLCNEGNVKIRNNIKETSEFSNEWETTSKLA